VWESRGEDLERLVAGLEEAGYEFLGWRGDRRGDLELRGRTGRLEIRLRPLRSGGHGPTEGSMRIWLPAGAAEPAAPGERVERLTLGYEPDLGVFAGWPVDDLDAAWRGYLWVPRRTLIEAAERGFALPRPNSDAYAFQGSRVGEYLAARRRRMRAEARRPSQRALGAPRGPGSIRDLIDNVQYDSGARRSRRALGRMYSAKGLPVLKKPRRKEIETGFSPASRPGEPLLRESSLEVNQKYFFWFGIGADFGHSIEKTPVPPPENVPDNARLTVKLFPFEGEMDLIGPTRGELVLRPDGRARVSRRAAAGPDDPDLRERLLFFPVRPAKRKGVQRLRCNLYYGSTLLQSRLISCEVGAVGAEPAGPGLASELDYSLATTVDLDTLARIPEHDLSLLSNGGGVTGQRTHQFRFFRGGDEEFDADASLGEQKIAKGIMGIRGALRRASWNTEDEFKKENKNRYPKAPGDPGRFAEDLIRMARRGRDLYLDITGNLSEGTKSRKELEVSTREPRRIQVASTDPNFYLPAAVFYDHPLETAPSAAEEAKYRLCDAFTAALDDSSAPLEKSPCVMGECPNRADTFVVCPSGFWGYRHEIGWPVGGAKPLTKVKFGGRAEMAIGVSTDKRLEFREEHVRRILAMGKGEVADSRGGFGALAKSTSPHLVYFYCHGGSTAPMGVPFLELGPQGSTGLNRSFLDSEEIKWEHHPRPVVFINGCHTTALEPETLSSLVGAFVEDAKAIGVVGTEVTVFESLACAFAEAVLGKFLDGSMTIGEAIRRARFDLLRDRIPLGLVYVPFIAADTQLV
jgi:Peptidase family C25